MLCFYLCVISSFFLPQKYALSFRICKKTIGFNPNAESGKEKIANVAKVGAIALTYIDGLAEGGGLIEGGIAGAAVAGGMATTVKGAIGAGKGFMEGFKEGIHITHVLGMDTMRYAFLTSLIR